MSGRRKAVIGGVALLVSLVLLLVSIPIARGWDGDLRTLLAAYTWSSSNTDATGYFYNSYTGMGVKGYSSQYIGVAGYGYGYGTYGSASYSYGQGVRGYSSGSYGTGVYAYAPGSSAYGVYSYSPYYIGVYGRGGSDSGDYGGYFYGFEGVHGTATGSNGYGTWGSAYGSYGIGAYGYGPYYIGVMGYGCKGVYGYARCSNSQGVYGYASTSAGEGVRGTTAGYAGDGVTALATSSYGYGMDSAGTGYGGLGIRAWAYGTGGWGGVFGSSYYRGIYADGASGYYDAYFPDMIYAGGTVVSSLGMSFVALNDGSEPLAPGDLVAFSGFVATDGSSEPAMAVVKASGASRGTIIGVMQSAYVKEAGVEMQSPLSMAEAAMSAAALQKQEVSPPEVEVLPGEKSAPQGESLPSLGPELEREAVEVVPQVTPDQVAPAQMEKVPVAADAGHFVEGSAEPGQYVVVMVQGIARVNVDASSGAIQAGDTVVASGTAYATAASRADAQARGGVSPMVIGRALEPLEAGKGTIYVFVNVR